MSEKKISYLDRNFEDYQTSLKEYVKKYYPSVSDSLDDASIGSWLIDIVAAVSDNLSYHLDRTYGETNLETANERSSVLNIARSNGLKIPGPKASIAEVKFKCTVPVTTEVKNSSSEVGMPNKAYAPIIKKGTKLNAGSQFFEVMKDINFNEMFDEDGNANTSVIPNREPNTGRILSYDIIKYETVVAGETKVYKQVLNNNDVYPFMEIILPDTNVLSVESIIFKDGSDYSSEPTMNEFMNQNEYVPASESPTYVDTYRFFEVNSLAEQYRWGDDISSTRGSNMDIGLPITYKYGYYDSNNDVTVPVYSITKGKWETVTQKFITEYTDNGYLKIIFGSGEIAGQTVDYNEAKTFSQNQITKMLRNNFLGKLPSPGWTMYIQYRTGGGTASNVAKGQINSIAFLNAEIGTCIGNGIDASIVSNVRNSIRVTNTTPSISGKDAPSVEELKQLIKYNAASQDRCVTLKDYLYKVNTMPSRYGCPFRIGAIEENNKIMLYLLGINYDGKLNSLIPSQLVSNMENYLSLYRSINDLVEIKAGRIINISFEVDVFIDKNYNTSDVISNIITIIKDYMDINKHQLGEDIYVGDIEKEVSKLDGVLNLIDMRVFNEYGEEYSKTQTNQEVKYDEEKIDYQSEIDLDKSDYVLRSDSDEMFEIKYPDNKDIRVRCKVK